MEPELCCCLLNSFSNNLHSLLAFNLEKRADNIFIVKGSMIKTPAVTEGCIKGVMRKKIIEIIEKNTDYTIEETSISPFEMQKADEIFITNSIIGIQPVTNYRKKEFKTEIGAKLAANLRLQQVITRN